MNLENKWPYVQILKRDVEQSNLKTKMKECCVAFIDILGFKDMVSKDIDCVVLALRYILFAERILIRGSISSGDTPQLKDYNNLDWEWSYSDPEEKRYRHETVFPQERKKAYNMDAEMSMSGKL